MQRSCGAQPPCRLTWASHQLHLGLSQCQLQLLQKPGESLCSAIVLQPLPFPALQCLCCPQEESLRLFQPTQG